MSKFADSEQESKFQEIFQEVNEIDYSAIGTPCLMLKENDLRLVFHAGMEFGKDVIGKDFGAYLQQKAILKKVLEDE